MVQKLRYFDIVFFVKVPLFCSTVAQIPVDEFSVQEWQVCKYDEF